MAYDQAIGGYLVVYILSNLLENISFYFKILDPSKKIVTE